MAFAKPWLIAIVRARLVTKNILNASFFPDEYLKYSAVWIDSNSSWKEADCIMPTQLCGQQGLHSDAKRSKDGDCQNQWHLEFLSALLGVWSSTTIFIPEKGDVEVPVGGLVIFSGSKSHAGKDCYVLLCAVC